MLDEIKILCEIQDDSQDTVLDIYMRRSINSIKKYLNNDRLDDNYIIQNYNDAIVELACRAYNTRKYNNVSNGIKQKSQGQRSITYIDSDMSNLFKITEDIASMLPATYVRFG